MAQAQPKDAKLGFIKFARAITYIAYAYCLVAAVFLFLGAFLLLFGANTDSGFVRFIYQGAENFLAPFRGIFPPHQVSDNGYFSTSAIFAVIVYLLVALCFHALINYITTKMVVHQQELNRAKAEIKQQKLASAQAAFRAGNSAKTQAAKPRPR